MFPKLTSTFSWSHLGLLRIYSIWSLKLLLIFTIVHKPDIQEENAIYLFANEHKEKIKDLLNFILIHSIVLSWIY